MAVVLGEGGGSVFGRGMEVKFSVVVSIKAAHFRQALILLIYAKDMKYYLKSCFHDHAISYMYTHKDAQMQIAFARPPSTNTASTSWAQRALLHSAQASRASFFSRRWSWGNGGEGLGSSR